MKIRFNTSVAGERFAYRRNQVVDLRVDIARGFIRAGQAELVPDEETAMAPGAPETTVARGRGRKRTLKNLGGLLH